MILKNYSAYKMAIYNSNITYSDDISSYGIKNENNDSVYSTDRQNAKNTGLSSNISFKLSSDNNISIDDYNIDAIPISLSVAQTNDIQLNKYVRTFVITGVNTTENTITIRKVGIFKEFYLRLNAMANSFTDTKILLAEEVVDDIVVEPNTEFTITVTWSEY